MKFREVGNVHAHGFRIYLTKISETIEIILM